MIKRLEEMISFLASIQVKLMLLAMDYEEIPEDLRLSISKGNEIVEQLIKTKQLVEEHAELLHLRLEEKDSCIS